MPNVDDPRMVIGLIGSLILLMSPLGQLLLIYGWERNFRLLVARQWLQEFWLYILLLLCLLVFIISIVLNSTRGPSWSASSDPFPISILPRVLEVSINPLWFPISLLAFGSSLLTPSTCIRRGSIFSGMNWFALILLLAIPLSYPLMSESVYRSFDALWIRAFAVFTFFISMAFAFIALFGSKWSTRTRSVIAAVVIVSIIVLGIIITDGLNYWAANMD